MWGRAGGEGSGNSAWETSRLLGRGVRETPRWGRAGGAGAGVLGPKIPEGMGRKSVVPLLKAPGRVRGGGIREGQVS